MNELTIIRKHGIYFENLSFISSIISILVFILACPLVTIFEWTWNIKHRHILNGFGVFFYNFRRFIFAYNTQTNVRLDNLCFQPSAWIFCIWIRWLAWQQRESANQLVNNCKQITYTAFTGRNIQFVLCSLLVEHELTVWPIDVSVGSARIRWVHGTIDSRPNI